jgi:hypothetical protein
MTDELPTTKAAGATGGSTAVPAAGPDPFDVDRLRLPQNFTAAAGVKKILTVVPVGRPPRESFFRVHLGESYSIHAAVLELKAEREVFLVVPDLLPDLAGEATVAPRQIVTAVTTQGNVSLWPLRLPGPDGRIDTWGQSALDGCEAAKTSWVRMTANMSAGMYDVFTAGGVLTDPAWPAVPFHELLRIAFRGKIIDSLDHPALRRLRGEVE